VAGIEARSFDEEAMNARNGRGLHTRGIVLEFRAWEWQPLLDFGIV